MSDTGKDTESTHWLVKLTYNKPEYVILGLYVIAWIIKILDTFIFRLDELIGEAILTKALGFLLVLAYLWVVKRKLTDIGFHIKNLGSSLFITLVGFGLIYVSAFLVQLLILRVSGEQAALVFSAVDPRTGLTGGCSWWATW